MSGDDIWLLDPDVVFLNHGSFGACPRPVLAHQAELRLRLERDPVRFFQHDMGPMLGSAREALAAFIGSDPDDLAFVPNATTGVNAVLRSLRFEPGDELLTTDHAYHACRNALDWVAERWGARVAVAAIPFPLLGPEQVVAAVLDVATDRTRLALIDHVTSPTGLAFPIDRIVAELENRGIDVLVDGAHAPGMVPLDVSEIGAAYYTGNCHKWMCAPKGAGFLHVRSDRQDRVVPTVISHGLDADTSEQSRFRQTFDWTGTADPTAVLSVAVAIATVGSLDPDGWDGVRRRNRDLAIEARAVLCDALEVEPPAPESMVGSMAAVPLPKAETPAPRGREFDPLQEALHDDCRIQVPIINWPAWPSRLVRISAQVYNRPEQYHALASALLELSRGRGAA